MTRPFRTLCALAAVCAALGASTAAASGPDDITLPVPLRSQVDGTIWAGSNCGPASLGMILEAFGDEVSNLSIRKRANELLGVSSPSTGTRIEHLARIAAEHGLSTNGPMQGKDYRRWTVDEVRAEVRQGHPVLVQVWLPLLPNQRANPVPTDHFVVVVGTAGDSFIYNDPANSHAPGYRQKMTEEQLAKAWRSSGAPYAAFSVGPGSAGESLLPPPPRPARPDRDPLVALEAVPNPIPAPSQTDPVPPAADPIPPASPAPVAAGDLGQVVAPAADEQPDQESPVLTIPLALGLVSVLAAGTVMSGSRKTAARPVPEVAASARRD